MRNKRQGIGREGEGLGKGDIGNGKRGRWSGKCQQGIGKWEKEQENRKTEWKMWMKE